MTANIQKGGGGGQTEALFKLLTVSGAKAGLLSLLVFT